MSFPFYDGKWVVVSWPNKNFQKVLLIARQGGIQKQNTFILCFSHGWIQHKHNINCHVNNYSILNIKYQFQYKVKECPLERKLNMACL